MEIYNVHKVRIGYKVGDYRSVWIFLPKEKIVFGYKYRDMFTR